MLGASSRARRGENMHTPLTQFHCDAVNELECIASHMSLMLTGQDVSVIL